MFDAVANGFQQAKNRLSGLTELNEQNIETALREVRLSLLEADVEMGVVRGFLERVKEKALGETVRVVAKDAAGNKIKVSAGEVFVKACHDELVALMSADGEPLKWATLGPTGVMMVGLQGSGKTTSTAKFARLLKKEGKKVLLVAADMQRPAAVEQLKVLGRSIDVPVFNIPGESPVVICQKAREEAAREKYDVVLYDTAGRLAIDEALMQELADIKAQSRPENIYLVIDAMIGQDAVRVSKGFHDRLGLTGVILSKLDGDARGGAALSVREVTGAPVRYVGMGETTDKFEQFRPEGMASRVLGMGDVVGLMKDFGEVIDQEKAAKDAMKMLSGQFTLDDFLEQIRMIQKMGSLKDLVGRMPGMGQLPADVNLDDRELVRVEAMIQSFTKYERRDANVLIREPSRVRRIAKGSGMSEDAVRELVQKFLFMKQMMDGMGKNMGSLGGLLGKIPGMNKAHALNQIRKMAQGGGMGGFPGMPGMGGMGDMMSALGGMGGFPGMPGMGGFPGMGGRSDIGQALDAMTKMKTLSDKEKNAKKAEKKRERQARKKGRK